MTKQLINDQLTSVKGVLSDFDAIFESRERLSVVCQSLTKYNLFLRSLNIVQLMASEDESSGSYIETQTKWAVINVAQKLNAVLRDGESCSRIGLADLKTLIHFTYGHIFRLVERSRNFSTANDAQVQIFKQSMIESHLEYLLGLYENIREQKEHALCVFAFLTLVFTLAGKTVRPDLKQRLSDIAIRIMNEVSRPSFFSEEVSREYFKHLASLMQ